jgi:hypothetical protein
MLPTLATRPKNSEAGSSRLYFCKQFELSEAVERLERLEPQESSGASLLPKVKSNSKVNI